MDTHDSSRNSSHSSLSRPRPPAGPDVYFDLEINGLPAGRIVFRLYDTICPITARNFRELATGQNGFGYAHSYIHRVVPNFLIQGGDIVDGNGTTGRSIYGPTFPDENFRLPHDRPGLLSMANRGPHTNSSQFFITVVPAPWCNSRNVVFGEVLKGMDIVRKVETYASDHILYKPSADILVAACGTL
ncbi:cyclophilin [Trametes gibbosa]|nr:cyclophilin [Trametes gibbosa]